MLRNDKTPLQIVKFMIEYVIETLDELSQASPVTDFTQGEINAFVECLEILSGWKDYPKYGIDDIEKVYHVK